MATRRALAYCSATDRNISVLVKLEPPGIGRKRPSYRDAERLVCLEYGVRCTGHLCPLFDLPTLCHEELAGYPALQPS